MPLLWLNAMLRYIKCDRASPQKLSIFNDNWIIYSVWSAIFLTTLKNNIYKGCVCLWLILIPKVGCSFVEIALPTEPLPSYSEYGWKFKERILFTNACYRRVIIINIGWLQHSQLQWHQNNKQKEKTAKK